MQHNDECAATNMLTSQQTQLAHASLCLFFCFALQIEFCATLLMGVMGLTTLQKSDFNGGFIVSLFGFPAADVNA